MIIYNCALIQCSLKLFDGMFKKKISKKKRLACIFVIFCVCCQIRAAIRKMRLGKSTGPSSKSVKLLGHLKTIYIYIYILTILIRSQHYLTKSMTQVGFHQTFPNPYLWHCQKKPGAAECELHIMNSL